MGYKLLQLEKKKDEHLAQISNGSPESDFCSFAKNARYCREIFDNFLQFQAEKYNLPYFLKDYCKAWANLGYCVMKANEICGLSEGDSESRIRATFLNTAPSEFAFCRFYIETLKYTSLKLHRQMELGDQKIHISRNICVVMQNLSI
ncbi:unnamed protein product [Gordionus sp. m RMFG-2023]